jgi:hypothetical protein
MTRLGLDGAEPLTAILESLRRYILKEPGDSSLLEGLPEPKTLTRTQVRHYALWQVIAATESYRRRNAH